MNKPKISALILAYNNEKEIERCIKSLAFADEVIVLDSFSDDQTAEISKKLGAKVFQSAFNTFGKLRNIALSHATHDWIFSLDTDEVATPKAIEEMQAILQDPKAKEVYFVPRLNTVFGKELHYGGWYPDYRQPQFFKKNCLKYREEDQVHEGFDILGTKGYLKNHIVQYPFDNLQHYLQKMERYSTLMAKRMQSEGKRFKIHKLFVNPIHSFFKRYLFRRGFLDGKQGLILACLYSYYTLLKYAKLWEIESGSQKVKEKRAPASLAQPN